MRDQTSEELDWIAELQGFAIRGLLHGYDGVVDHRDSESFPGHKEYAISGGRDLRFFDAWTKRSGFSLLFCNSYKCWEMGYQGSYLEEDIPFLKLALAEAHEEGYFGGCRGPRAFFSPAHPHLRYENSFEGTFAGFYGTERIIDIRSNKTRGSHTYQGGICIPFEHITRYSGS